MLLLCQLLSKGFFVFCKPVRLGFQLAVQALGVICKVVYKSFNAKSLFPGNLPLFKGSHKVFQLTAGVNQEIVHFLRLAFFKFVFLAAKFQFLLLKTVQLFLCLGCLAFGFLLNLVQFNVLAVETAD